MLCLFVLIHLGVGDYPIAVTGFEVGGNLVDFVEGCQGKIVFAGAGEVYGEAIECFRIVRGELKGSLVCFYCQFEVVH